MNKILYIAVSSQTGGVPKHILNTLMQAPKNDYEITVAVPDDGDYYQWFQESASDMQNLTLKPYSLKALWVLRNYVVKHKISLVHSHGKGAGMYSRPLKLLCPGIKVVHTFHGIYLEQYGILLKKLYCGIEHILRHWTDVFICVSDSEKEEAMALGFAYERCTEVIANGVDLKEMQNTGIDENLYLEKYGFPRDSYLIGCVARLEKMKGHCYLLKAFACVSNKYPKCRLLLVGDGPDRQELEACIKDLKLEDKVILTGFRHDIPQLLKQFDLFVSASLKEGMPYTLIEALAVGVPVVATDVIGNRDVIGDGKEGFLAYPKDEKSLANQMIKAIEHPELCREYVLAGKRKVEQELTAELSVRKLFNIYDKVLEGKQNEKS